MIGCRVSVVIPVYNAEKYLAECLDSVLGQTLRDFEVVCVDDGSTDGSATILKEYAAKDSRIKVFRQANAGPGPARNRALDMACGDCVVFMDPDDKYPSPDTLERLYAALEESGLDVSGGSARCFPEDNPGAMWKNARSTRSCRFPKLGAVDYSEYQVPFRYICFMFRRRLLEGIRFPALCTFQDVPFFAAVMAKAGRFAAIDACVYSYRIHGGNGSMNMTPVKLKARLSGMRMVMDIASRAGYWRMYDSMLRRAWHVVFRYRLGFFSKVRAFGTFRTLWEMIDLESLAAKRGGIWPLAQGFAVKVLLRLSSAVFRMFSLNRHRVFMQTFQGEYCCNPKYVTEALSSMDGPEIVWALSRTADETDIPIGARVVRKGTLKCFFMAATAKVWFENGLNMVRSKHIRKRRGQVYMQPLHGSLGLKRQGLAGFSVRDKADRITDFCISNSAFETEVYRTSYWPTTEILEYGHPRNDVFFRSSDEKSRIMARVREAIGVGPDLRLALYAPTFRPDGDVTCLDLDPVMLKEALEKKFGGEWAVLFRLHKRDMSRHHAPPGSWIDVSRYPDMQELMLACEVGITDYSSWICDYVLGDGFGFLYAKDVDRYSANPGFYYPLETTPFPIARSNDELATAIAALDSGKYHERKIAFIASKGCFDDGSASERCARKIMEVLGS